MPGPPDRRAEGELMPASPEMFWWLVAVVALLAAGWGVHLAAHLMRRKRRERESYERRHDAERPLG